MDINKFRKKGAVPTAPTTWGALQSVGVGFSLAGDLLFIENPPDAYNYIKRYVSTAPSAAVCRAFHSKTQNTEWTTVANVTGSGYLLWLVVTNFTGAYSQFRVTIDGVAKASAVSAPMMTLGAVGDFAKKYALIDRIASDKPSADMTDNQKLYCKSQAAIRGIKFDTSLKIEYRSNTTHVSEIRAAADYYLDGEV